MFNFVKQIVKFWKGIMPMKKPENKKELEEKLRKFFEVDRALPKVVPSLPVSLIGKMIVIPDDERSIEDILEDADRFKSFLTTEDIALYDAVAEWFKLVHGLNRAVVIKRCMGKGWKRIAKELVKDGHSYRYLHRATLWRHFNEGLEEILKRF